MIGEVSIRFVHIGIEWNNLGKYFNIYGFKIAYYGITMAIAILFGMLLTFRGAQKSGQNVDDYYNLSIWVVISALVGARIYYVIFRLENYKNDIISILNFRQGGIAMYGSIIGGLVAAFIYTHRKKMDFFQVVDTVIPGLLVGQIIGRWGNFFNREAYGGYTDSFFAMQIKMDEASGVITEQIRNHIKVVDGVEYIQVHPTFLYESLYNLILLIIILIIRKYKKFEGEIAVYYMIGYGFGRFFIEGLRTDQLLIPYLKIAISQVISIAIFLVGIVIMIKKRFLEKSKNIIK